ncbi:MAG: ribosome silencing factor [Planctomycetes bacterium]|nr:ribosome silencing factor [Planctomycetota bacterium]
MVIETLDIARFAFEACLDKKATEVRLLDVAKLTIVAEYFVVCTAQSAPQARAIAEHIGKLAKDKGLRRPAGLEGMQEGWWVLVDLGDVLVHVFQEDARRYYALDETWADAPVLQTTDAA